MSDDPCPVCKDDYAHTTRPTENESSVSGMHVCYSVDDGGQLVMYIHEDVSDEEDRMQEWLDEREHLRSERSLKIREIARRNAHLPD